MTIDQILEGKPYEIQEIFHKLRRVLISLPQNIKEELCTKQGVKKCSYELNGKMIATLEPLKDHCILFLYQTEGRH